MIMVSVGIGAVLGGSGFKEATAMLCPEYYRVRLSAFDEQIKDASHEIANIAVPSSPVAFAARHKLALSN